MLAMGFAAFACGLPPQALGALPIANEDIAAPADDDTAPRKAVFAAGCFWCVEAVFEKLDGVSDVVSGYAGGSAETANYEQVSTGRTAHAEAVEITYDPRKVTFGQLLRVYFATHDPTTKDRQGPDVGPQYRSAIFYANPDEQRVAKAYIDQLTEAKSFRDPIVTTLEPLTEERPFFAAEKYHQDFATDNPTHPYIRRWVTGKYEKLRKQFGEMLRQAEESTDSR